MPMKAESRDKRRDEILDIAVEVLAEKGFRDTSMLEIAKRASASKETLYAWFGDKQGLFKAVIERNARSVQNVLAQHLGGSAPLETALAEFGLALLDLLLGDSAVALNRAAISEAKSDPTLAETLSVAGREATFPGFVAFLEEHRRRGTLRDVPPEQAAEQFLGLLLGDLQIRRLLGVAPEPGRAAIAERAARASEAFMTLYAA
jgi:AcrR family transcriptional regulator